MSITQALLTELLKDAATAHHKYEESLGKPHAEWAEWYAAYIFSKLNKIGCWRDAIKTL